MTTLKDKNKQMTRYIVFLYVFFFALSFGSVFGNLFVGNEIAFSISVLSSSLFVIALLNNYVLVNIAKKEVQR